MMTIKKALFGEDDWKKQEEKLFNVYVDLEKK